MSDLWMLNLFLFMFFTTLAGASVGIAGVLAFIALVSNLKEMRREKK